MFAPKITKFHYSSNPVNAGLGEAIGLPVASPVGIAVHRSIISEIIGVGWVVWVQGSVQAVVQAVIQAVVWVGKVILSATVFRASGVNNMCVSNVHDISIVGDAVSMDDKIAIGWAIWGWGLLCDLGEWEVFQNQWAVRMLNCLNRGVA